MLQGSLSGAGARIAVVACVTPASSQAEETHNTLKFATRAKKVWRKPALFPTLTIIMLISTLTVSAARATKPRCCLIVYCEMEALQWNNGPLSAALLSSFICLAASCGMHIDAGTVDTLASRAAVTFVACADRGGGEAGRHPRRGQPDCAVPVGADGPARRAGCAAPRRCVRGVEQYSAPGTALGTHTSSVS